MLAAPVDCLASPEQQVKALVYSNSHTNSSNSAAVSVAVFLGPRPHLSSLLVDFLASSLNNSNLKVDCSGQNRKVLEVFSASHNSNSNSQAAFLHKNRRRWEEDSFLSSLNSNQDFSQEVKLLKFKLTILDNNRRILPHHLLTLTSIVRLIHLASQTLSLQKTTQCKIYKRR